MAELTARSLAPHLDPVRAWPRTDYVTHEQGLAARADDLEVLVVGSSVVGRALAPDAVAAAGGPDPGYNYWLAGPPMRSISRLTTDVLLERTSPSVVVIGISMREFNDGPSQRAHFQALLASHGYQAAAGGAGPIDTLDQALQSVSALARHRQALRDPATLLQELRTGPLVPEQIGPDGFLVDRGQSQLADEPESHRRQERAAMDDYEVDPADIEALADLLDELRGRGVRALVVNLPVTEHFIEMADDGRRDYEAYREQVRATTRSYDSEWLDTMDRPWPDELFGDVNHLNDRGAAELQPLILGALSGR